MSSVCYDRECENNDSNREDGVGYCLPGLVEVPDVVEESMMEEIEQNNRAQKDRKQEVVILLKAFGVDYEKCKADKEQIDEGV